MARNGVVGVNAAATGADTFRFGSELCRLEELREYLNCIRGICTQKMQDSEKLRSAEEISVRCGFSSWGKTSEYIIMLCQHWKLSDETKYKAIEILARFMSSLISQLHNVIHGKSKDHDTAMETNQCKESGHVSSDLEAGSVLSAADRDNHQGWVKSKNEKCDADTGNSEWEETLEHIKSQMKLRAVTAIMIASKVTAHDHIVTLNKAIDILIKQNHIYSKNVIVKSELRILNTVNYNLRLLDTPYPCVMILLEILCRIDDHCNGTNIHDICIHLLDLYYFHQPKVLSELSEISVSESGLPELHGKEKTMYFLNTCYDVLKICGALLAAAVYIYDRKLSDVAITNLCDIVETSEEKLLRGCCVMLRTLLQKDF